MLNLYHFSNEMRYEYDSTLEPFDLLHPQWHADLMVKENTTHDADKKKTLNILAIHKSRFAISIIDCNNEMTLNEINKIIY